MNRNGRQSHGPGREETVNPQISKLLEERPTNIRHPITKCNNINDNKYSLRRRTSIDKTTHKIKVTK